MLSELDRMMHKEKKTSLKFDDFKPIPRETESSRYKYIKYNPDDQVNKILNRSIQNHSDLEGQWMKIIILSNTKDINTRCEILLRLKVSGHSETLTEASNLIDQLYERGEIQNEQEHQNAGDKFCTQ